MDNYQRNYARRLKADRALLARMLGRGRRRGYDAFTRGYAEGFLLGAVFDLRTFEQVGRILRMNSVY